MECTWTHQSKVDSHRDLKLQGVLLERIAAGRGRFNQSTLADTTRQLREVARDDIPNWTIRRMERTDICQ